MSCIPLIRDEAADEWGTRRSAPRFLLPTAYSLFGYISLGALAGGMMAFMRRYSTA
jgi:hypothetical protein